MLACLMSNYEVVKFLVVFKSVNISKANRMKITAIDFARENDLTRSIKEEYIDAGVGKENALAVLNRPEILGLLESPARRTTLKNEHRRGGDLKYHDYKFAKIGTKIGVYGLVSMVETGMSLTRNKTIGMLMPAGDDLPTFTLFDFAEHAESAEVSGPTLYAASGWKEDDKRDPQVVDSEKWCSIAHQLASKRGNGTMALFPPTDMQKGRGAACHVEVLLATMYAFSLTEGLVARRPEQTEEDYVREQLFRLKKIREMMLGKRRYMVIYIDSWPCRSCLEYVAAMEHLTGLWLRIKAGCGMGPPLRLGGNRRDVYGEVFEDEDGLSAEVEGAMWADPKLMDGHRYRTPQDVMTDIPSEHDETPSSIDDDDDSAHPEMLCTPPVTPQDVLEVSGPTQLAFRDRLSTFVCQPQLKRSIPRPERKARYTPFKVPNPLDFRPWPPTPVLHDPSLSRITPDSGDETVVESMEVDEEEEEDEGEEESYCYSNLQFGAL
ncbi:hypothetical protein PG994_003919 [Apiospora phragmitis]|uniref:Uncharacterized protein n=1 Tax=Apiospora phragmitis TaxID=2905665 RepID=A0ABR1VZK5_9PEZI